MTLSELAQLLKVSPSTISRALHRPEMVAEATRERILAAVAKHGYRTNGIARSLRKGETQTVGLVVADLQNPFYSVMVKAIENTLSAEGYSCVICDADESQHKEQRALRLLGELQVSGIIHGFSGSDPHTFERLGLHGIPIVEIDRASGNPEADTVLLDNVMCAGLAVDHLIELGHTQIGTIAGPQHLTTGRERLEGFRLAIRSGGLEPRDELVRIGDFRQDSGYSAAKELLAMPERPSALFIANNEMMAGAITAVREAGLAIPDDISVVSVDDPRWARYVDPPLTVVAQPLEAMGQTAARLLLERLAGRQDPVKRVFPPTLIPRASTAPGPNSSNRQPGPPAPEDNSTWRRPSTVDGGLKGKGRR